MSRWTRSRSTSTAACRRCWAAWRSQPPPRAARRWCSSRSRASRSYWPARPRSRSVRRSSWHSSPSWRRRTGKWGWRRSGPSGPRLEAGSASSSPPTTTWPTTSSAACPASPSSSRTATSPSPPWAAFLLFGVDFFLASRVEMFIYLSNDLSDTMENLKFSLYDDDPRFNRRETHCQ